MAQAICSSWTPRTTASAWYPRMGPSPRWRAMAFLATPAMADPPPARNSVLRTRYTGSIPQAWRWTAPATSTFRTMETFASARSHPPASSARWLEVGEPLATPAMGTRDCRSDACSNRPCGRQHRQPVYRRRNARVRRVPRRDHHHGRRECFRLFRRRRARLRRTDQLSIWLWRRQPRAMFTLPTGLQRNPLAAAHQLSPCGQRDRQRRERPSPAPSPRARSWSSGAPDSVPGN